MEETSWLKPSQPERCVFRRVEKQQDIWELNRMPNGASKRVFSQEDQPKSLSYVVIILFYFILLLSWRKYGFMLYVFTGGQAEGRKGTGLSLQHITAFPGLVLYPHPCCSRLWGEKLSCHSPCRLLVEQPLQNPAHQSHSTNKSFENLMDDSLGRAWEQKATHTMPGSNSSVEKPHWVCRYHCACQEKGIVGTMCPSLTVYTGYWVLTHSQFEKHAQNHWHGKEVDFAAVAAIAAFLCSPKHNQGRERNQDL